MSTRRESPDDGRAAEYLLGKLPEAEQVVLEQQVLADEAQYERMLAIEDELMYAYLRGDLDRDDGRLFEQRFLSTAEGRRRETFAKALNQTLRAGESRRPRAAASYWIPLAAAAVLTVACGWLAIETVRLRQEITRVRGEQAAQVLAAQDQLAAARARATPPRTILSFVLTPGRTRSAGDLSRLLVPAETDIVRLQLTLPGARRAESYRAVIRTAEGAQVWSDTLRPQQSADAVVIAEVPASALVPGDYELTLSDRSYYFTIARR